MKGKEEEKDFRALVIIAGFLDTPRAIAHRRGTAKEKEEEIKAKEKESFWGTCYNCGMAGHSQRYCPSWSKGGSKGKEGKGKGKRGLNEVTNAEMYDEWNRETQVLGGSMDQGSLNLIEREDECRGELNMVEGEWEKIRVNVDSGAVDWVTNKETARAFDVKPTRASKDGRGYRAANGTKIKNYGERVVEGFTEDWSPVKVAMQVADVNKTLGSVYRMNECGNRVMLDGEESYIENKMTGKKTKIYLENGQYVFYMWVKKREEDEGVSSKRVLRGNKFAPLAEEDDKMELDFIRREARR
jgi:hypothetical protein